MLERERETEGSKSSVERTDGRTRIENSWKLSSQRVIFDQRQMRECAQGKLPSSGTHRQAAIDISDRGGSEKERGKEHKQTALLKLLGSLSLQRLSNHSNGSNVCSSKAPMPLSDSPRLKPTGVLSSWPRSISGVSLVDSSTGELAPHLPISHAALGTSL